MPKYEVIITETMIDRLIVYAGSPHEAEVIAYHDHQSPAQGVDDVEYEVTELEYD